MKNENCDKVFLWVLGSIPASYCETGLWVGHFGTAIYFLSYMNDIWALRGDLRLSEISQLQGALSGPKTSCRYSIGPSGSHKRLPPLMQTLANCLPPPPLQQPWLRKQVLCNFHQYNLLCLVLISPAFWVQECAEKSIKGGGETVNVAFLIVHFL